MSDNLRGVVAYSTIGLGFYLLAKAFASTLSPRIVLALVVAAVAAEVVAVINAVFYAVAKHRGDL